MILGREIRGRNLWSTQSRFVDRRAWRPNYTGASLNSFHLLSIELEPPRKVSFLQAGSITSSVFRPRPILHKHHRQQARSGKPRRNLCHIGVPTSADVARRVDKGVGGEGVGGCAGVREEWARVGREGGEEAAGCDELLVEHFVLEFRFGFGIGIWCGWCRRVC